MRLLLCSLLFGSFAALGLISCAERPDSLPSFARPDRVAALKEIGSGTKPAGAGSTNPYWVFGGDSSFPSLKSTLEDGLHRRGWRTGEDEAGDLYVSSPDESYCIGFHDLASGSGYSRNALAIVRDSSVRLRLKQFKVVVMTVISGCG